MRCVYNLEYSILDKIGRAKKTSHVGVFADIESVEKAKFKILDQVKDKLSFKVYVIQTPV